MSLFISKNEIPWKNSPENTANTKEIIVDPRENGDVDYDIRNICSRVWKVKQ